MDKADERTEHRYQGDEETDWPHVGYNPQEFPDVRDSIELLNEVALLDQETACIQYPAGDAEHHKEVTSRLRARADDSINHKMAVISFDIDLTLRMGEDHEEGLSLIDPGAIGDLQEQGYIVGTCSDREPSDQRKTLLALGQEPHFCIPKEMLGWAKELLPAELHLHIGDDERRDRRMAESSGWSHQWPSDFKDS